MKKVALILLILAGINILSMESGEENSSPSSSFSEDEFVWDKPWEPDPLIYKISHNTKPSPEDLKKLPLINKLFNKAIKKQDLTLALHVIQYFRKFYGPVVSEEDKIHVRAISRFVRMLHLRNSLLNLEQQGFEKGVLYKKLYSKLVQKINELDSYIKENEHIIYLSEWKGFEVSFIRFNLHLFASKTIQKCLVKLYPNLTYLINDYPEGNIPGSLISVLVEMIPIRDTNAEGQTLLEILCALPENKATIETVKSLIINGAAHRASFGRKEAIKAKNRETAKILREIRAHQLDSSDLRKTVLVNNTCKFLKGSYLN